MWITLNGERREIPDGTTAEALVRIVGVPPEAALVERNRAVIPRAEIASTILAEGDEIELVRFVGGG